MSPWIPVSSNPAFWGKFSVIKIENPEGSWERGSGYGKRDIYTRK